MVSAIKQYAPLDMTDRNKVVNLGDPTDPQDAATKVYVDSSTFQDPMISDGDMIFADPIGEALLASFGGPYVAGGTGYIASRVTGIPTGATIRVRWQGLSTYGGRDQYLYGFITNGVTPVASTVAADIGSGTYVDFTATLTLTGGATEIQLWVSGDNRASIRNITYTNLAAFAPSRLPVGSEGSALRVSSGVPVWQPEVGALEIGIDGHGAVPQTGVRADLTIPYDMTITDWSIIADEAGSMQLDIWKSTLAAYPPVDAGSITGSAPPALSNALTAASAALTGWSPALVKGDCLRINLDSVSTLTRATITLAFTKT